MDEDIETLKLWLKEARVARHNLLRGKGALEISQSTGAGAAKLMNHATDLTSLACYILELETEIACRLGLESHIRRPFYL